jgi:hypothetical protein
MQQDAALKLGQLRHGYIGISIMLRFQIQPDPVFVDLLDEAIEQITAEMDLKEPREQADVFTEQMPRSSRFFTAQQAKEQLRALQRALHAAELYTPTDTTGSSCMSV